MPNFITDEEVEAALDYLRDSAVPAAEARAHRIYLEEYRKSLKSQLMAEHLDDPVNAQERFAYADVRYREHLEALKEAIFQDEKRRFLLTAATVKIECWRTQCSNERVGL